MIGIIRALWWIVSSLFKSREQLEAENLALRHQVNLLRRSAPRRLRLRKQITKEVTWLMAINDDLAEGFLQHNQLTRKFGTHNPLRSHPMA